MKNSIVILGITALTAASIPTADAGNREWATVGKVLTGVAAVHAISHILPPPHVVIAAPAPVVHMQSRAPIIISGPSYCSPPAPVIVYAPPFCPPPRLVAIPHLRHAPYVSVQLGFDHHHHHRNCR